MRRSPHPSLLRPSAVWVAAFWLAMAALGGCSKSAPPLPEGPVRVVASILPLAGLARAVAGPDAEVMALVGPGDSHATFEPTPRDMATLDAARLFLRAYVPFERVWIDRIERGRPHLRLVDAVLPAELSPADPTDDHGHDHGPLDPHVWSSPRRAVPIVERIRDALVEVDPAHADGYRARADAYIAELRALDAEVAQILSGHQGKRFLVFHPAWGYFAEDYGLEQIAIEVEGKEPGPKGLAEVIGRARGLGIHVVFVQEQFSRQTAEAVARQIGAKVISVDPMAEDYIPNMRRVATTFAEALR
jgi:zinc transport system substrate-binding protein